MLLCRADITSKNPDKVKRYLNNYEIVLEKAKEVEEKDKLRAFKSPVNGNEIMTIFELPPGPEVGRIKKGMGCSMDPERVMDHGPGVIMPQLSMPIPILSYRLSTIAFPLTRDSTDGSENFSPRGSDAERLS